MQGDKPDDQDTRDREALEHVIGTSRSQAAWPGDALPAGTRVVVLKDPEWDGPWQQVFVGTINPTLPPELVDHTEANPGEYAYLVEFDEPQYDHSREGPYRKAEIWDRYLR